MNLHLALSQLGKPSSRCHSSWGEHGGGDDSEFSSCWQEEPQRSKAVLVDSPALVCITRIWERSANPGSNCSVMAFALVGGSILGCITPKTFKDGTLAGSQEQHDWLAPCQSTEGWGKSLHLQLFSLCGCTLSVQAETLWVKTFHA